MKALSTCRFVLVATLLMSAVPVWPDSGTPGLTEAEDALRKVFAAYCDSFQKSPPEVCTKKGVSTAQQYLVLEEVCGADDSILGCLGFADAKTKKGKETLEPLVLALDHQTGRWHARNRLKDADTARVKFDVAGEPTVSLAKQERIAVIVENTNPLLYGAVAGKPTEVDVPELAEIQKLLTKFGGGLSSLIAVAGAQETVPGAAEGEPELKKYTRAIKCVLDDVQKAYKEVKCRADQVAGQTNRAVSFVQALELGNTSEYYLKPLDPPLCPKPAVSRLLTKDAASSFDKLQSALISPQNRPEGCDVENRVFSPQNRFEDCTALLDAAREVINADPADPEKVRAALLQFDQKTEAGSCAQFHDLKAELHRTLLGVRDNLEETEAAIEVRANAVELKQLSEVEKPTPAQKKRLAELRQQKAEAEKETRDRLVLMREELRDLKEKELEKLQHASTLGKELVPIRKAAEEILAKSGEVQKAAAQVEVFERRLDRYRLREIGQCGAIPLVDCVESTSLDSRLILEPQLKDVKQTKIQKHSLTVKPDSPYASKVVTTHSAELKGEYSLDSVLRGLWGISASVIYTELASKTFGAVTSEDDPEKMVIAVTDETTRAGEIALLADFRLARWALCRKASVKCGPKANWFGLEVGAGIGDDAAFFGGISLRPSRSWRLGVGYTYQQVKDLQRGLSLGQEVAGAEDVRTRDRFEGKWYLSLSFALDSLRLFSSGD